MATPLNSNLILLIQRLERGRRQAVVDFKFQSDSINTTTASDVI